MASATSPSASRHGLPDSKLPTRPAEATPCHFVGRLFEELGRGGGGGSHGGNAPSLSTTAVPRRHRGRRCGETGRASDGDELEVSRSEVRPWAADLAGSDLVRQFGTRRRPAAGERHRHVSAELFTTQSRGPRRDHAARSVRKSVAGSFKSLPERDWVFDCSAPTGVSWV